MTDPRPGRYKLAKQTAWTACFAHVAVTVEPATSDQFTIAAPSAAIRGWDAPARSGAEAAVRELRERGVLATPQHVVITDFIGTTVDTTDDAAYWATLMAVFTAFPEAEPPRLELSRDANGLVRR